MKEDLCYINYGVAVQALKYGFGYVELNMLHLKEGKKNNDEIINAVTAFCASGEAHVIHMDIWTDDFCEIEFRATTRERAQEIKDFILSSNFSCENPETRLSYRLHYDIAVTGPYANAFLKANEGKSIVYQGRPFKIFYHGKYNDCRTSAILLKPRARKYGTVIDEISICMAGIENGFIGSMA